MKEILFYPSRKKSLITIFISILFSSLAIYFLYSDMPFSRDWWIGFVMLGLFGVGSIIILYTTFINPVPSLILNEQGIFAYKCPFIEWNNVRDIQIKKQKWVTFLCVLPYNASKLIDQEKLGYLKKLNLYLNSMIFGTIIEVRIDDLSITRTDLIELISEYKKNWADTYLKN